MTTELEEAKKLLLEARDVMSFDQWPVEQQCSEILKTRDKIAKFLNLPDPWLEQCLDITKSMEAHVRKTILE